MLNKLKGFIKKRWAYLLSLLFIWIVPIVMLNEVVALVEVNVAYKITFAGCLVVFIVFLAFRKKIYALIQKMPHGVTRGVLLCVHKAIMYGLILGVMWGINAFSGKFFDWWLLCGISWLIGFIFLIIDENNCKEKKEQIEGERKED